MPYPQVVRIFATTQDPDYDCPWQARNPNTCTGSGVLIGRGEVLTGAHVVANATFLQVQEATNPNKFVAKVKAVCHDLDLALLEVPNDGFGKGINPAAVGGLPNLRDKVSVVGYPVGGEEISITEGVVSRIEVQTYSHSQRNALAVTVDAAINEGNSGGPVFFKDGRVAGVAFQKLADADSVGEMVPAPIIKHFLAGVAQGKACILPGFGFSTQNLENPLLRERVGLTNGDTGALVVSVEYGSSAWGHLRPRDALLEVDGLRLANNATITYANRHRTRYNAVLAHHHAGDEVELLVLRQGERLRQRIVLKPAAPLVPRNAYDRKPTYFVYGGMVFQTLTRDLLATWDKWWERAPKEFLYYYHSGVRTERQQEIVVLTQVLADEINVGYEELYNESVLSVNGETPRDMVDFVRRIEASRGVVEIRMSGRGIAVFDNRTVHATTARILDRYHIGCDRSHDLPSPPG